MFMENTPLFKEKKSGVFHEKLILWNEVTIRFQSYIYEQIFRHHYLV